MAPGFVLSKQPVDSRTGFAGGAQEYEHFVYFDDLDDMVDKVRYYAKAENECRAIASAGRRLLEKTFNFKRYGAFVVSEMNAAANGRLASTAGYSWAGR